jgi:hypothetical protein
MLGKAELQGETGWKFPADINERQIEPLTQGLTYELVRFGPIDPRFGKPVEDCLDRLLGE